MKFKLKRKEIKCESKVFIFRIEIGNNWLISAMCCPVYSLYPRALDTIFDVKHTATTTRAHIVNMCLSVSLYVYVTNVMYQ